MPLPVNYTEIRCWSDLTGNVPSTEEVEMLMQANNVYQRVIYG